MSPRSLIPLASLLITLGGGAAASVAATPSADDHRPPPRHGPPAAAFAACADLAEGDACTVTFHDRTIDGVCRVGPGDDERLVCLPNGPPPPEPGATPGD